METFLFHLQNFFVKLCSKTGATFVCDDVFYGAKNKEKVTFKCACGKDELVTMEVRSIRHCLKDEIGTLVEDPSALCKECMKKRKSERISLNKKREREEIADPIRQQRCTKTKCGKVFDKSHFKDDNGRPTKTSKPKTS